MVNQDLKDEKDVLATQSGESVADSSQASEMDVQQDGIPPIPPSDSNPYSENKIKHSGCFFTSLVFTIIPLILTLFVVLRCSSAVQSDNKLCQEDEAREEAFYNEVVTVEMDTTDDSTDNPVEIQMTRGKLHDYYKSRANNDIYYDSIALSTEFGKEIIQYRQGLMENTYNVHPARYCGTGVAMTALFSLFAIAVLGGGSLIFLTITIVIWYRDKKKHTSQIENSGTTDS